MKTLRLLALTSLVAGFGLMTGCDTTASSSAPEITEFETANFTDATDTWTSGMDLEFYGTAKDDNSLKTLTLEIVNSAGTAVYTSTKNVSGTSIDFGSGEDIVFTINNPGTWVAGAYTAKLTAADNDGLTATKTITLAKVAGSGTTTPTGTAVTSTTVTLGSNDNATYGSSIDADAMVAYKISQITTTALQGEVDAYYAYSSTAKADKFFSPSQAKTSGFDGIKNWSVSTTVALYNLGTMTSTAFAALTTQEAIDALFTGKSSVVSVDAASDVVVGIKTSAGVYRVLHVDAITAGSTGTVTVKGYK
jgi:hypothetical protein